MHKEDMERGSKWEFLREQKDFWLGGNYVLRKAARKQKKMLKGTILMMLAIPVFALALKMIRDNE